MALGLAGALAEAAEAVEGYLEAVETQLPQLVGIWTGLRGIVAKAQGRMTPAQQALRELDRAARRPRPGPCLQRLYLSELVGAHAMAGDTGGADHRLARMEDSWAPPGALVDPWIYRNRAWADVAARSASSAPGTAARPGSCAAPFSSSGWR